MSYTIVVPKSVQKQLDRLPEQIYQRILQKIQLLTEEPSPSLAYDHSNDGTTLVLG